MSSYRYSTSDSSDDELIYMYKDEEIDIDRKEWKIIQCIKYLFCGFC